ncbi:CHASE2 domain-containing protein [Thermodesulfobacteriota bacterium]
MPGHNSGRKRLQRGIVIGLVSGIAALLLWQAGIFVSWESKTWDWRVRILARPSQYTDKIKLILLDQDSLDWGEKENGLSWPWPREIYTPIINYCRRSGAKSLTFDVLFTESSQYGVQDDNSLGKAIRGFGNWVGALFLGRTTGSASQWPENSPQPSLTLTGIENLPEKAVNKITYPRATFPVPQVLANAGLLANVHLDPDPDGIYRRTHLFSFFGKDIIPSLSLGAYLASSNEAKGRIEPGSLSIGTRQITLGENLDTILNFRGPAGTFQAYSAAAVIQSELRLLSGDKPPIREQSPFKDCYVFLGFTAPGLFDLKPTPIAGVYPGVEIHATALDNLLAEDFHRLASPLLVIALAVTLALLAGVTVSWCTRGATIFISFLLFVSLPVLLAFLAYNVQIWLPLIVLAAGVLFSLTGALFFNFITEGRQKRFIKQAFRQYLSPAVIDLLLKHPERLKLGGERRILSIFFSDLQGFTSISEKMDPEELTALLNEYLSVMTGIIHEEGGTVDKYEGDAIIAFWNAPVDQEDHAECAVRAALRCQAALAEMRPRLRKQVGGDLMMRIGINTGEVVVGNMGSHTRFDYTMLGDAVNLAARLEGINKQFCTYTIISAATLAAMGQAFPVRELSRVQVVGRKEPVTIYEPFLPQDYNKIQGILAVFAKGLHCYYEGDFRKAVSCFAETAETDPAAKAYMKRIEAMEEYPTQGWQGVWVVTSK